MSSGLKVASHFAMCSAKNGMTALPLSAITRLLWRGYMDVCLANARHIMAPLASPA